ncbi:BAH_G0045730.mRNA.1.CDS.1 [Saccharomyces cerevisiae]|nr:BAH_G0045730.mRNA.1.CDS.1 [Saccharomyces cerevisiae]CAI7291477.1 BAH_G0045730.mRNA.1.CDS.1 [Saccharomyces cerevisiae]
MQIPKVSREPNPTPFLSLEKTQREIDLETSLDTLDSKSILTFRSSRIRFFPSNNLVYEGLPHPAEQSPNFEPLTPLIERRFRRH